MAPSPAAGPAGGHARAVHGGDHHPDDALDHARGEAERLRADRPEQGAAGAARPLPAHAEERADPGGDADRRGGWQPAGRDRHHRVRVHLARSEHAADHGREPPRLPDGPGASCWSSPLRVRADQPAGRPAQCVPRPTHPVRAGP